MPRNTQVPIFWISGLYRLPHEAGQALEHGEKICMAASAKHWEIPQESIFWEGMNFPRRQRCVSWMAFSRISFKVKCA